MNIRPSIINYVYKGEVTLFTVFIKDNYCDVINAHTEWTCIALINDQHNQSLFIHVEFTHHSISDITIPMQLTIIIERRDHQLRRIRLDGL